MKQYIKEKRYNKFKDDQTCSFTFDININCTEFGYTSIENEYVYKNYTAYGDSPILGCFSFYINLFGANNSVIPKN